MLVVELDRARLESELLPELGRLQDAGVARLLDLLVVRKPVGGELEVVDWTVEAGGAIAGPLLGLDDGDDEERTLASVAGTHLFEDVDVWYLDDRIPEGHTAVVVLLEHLWAVPLRDRLLDAGAVALADEWVHPADLLAVGATRAMGVAGAAH
jgi:hypothetical protein